MPVPQAAQAIKSVLKALVFAGVLATGGCADIDLSSFNDDAYGYDGGHYDNGGYYDASGHYRHPDPRTGG